MRNKVNIISITVVILILATISYSVHAQTTKSSDKAASAFVTTFNNQELVVTHHQARIGTRVLKYTATAGLLPIRNNETGEVHGNILFVAYALDRAPGDPKRPLMSTC